MTETQPKNYPSKLHYQNNPEKYQAHKDKVLANYHANKDEINARRRLRRRKPKPTVSTE